MIFKSQWIKNYIKIKRIFLGLPFFVDEKTKSPQLLAPGDVDLRPDLLHVPIGSYRIMVLGWFPWSFGNLFQIQCPDQSFSKFSVGFKFILECFIYVFNPKYWRFFHSLVSLYISYWIFFGCFNPKWHVSPVSPVSPCGLGMVQLRGTPWLASLTWPCRDMSSPRRSETAGGSWGQLGAGPGDTSGLRSPQWWAMSGSSVVSPFDPYACVVNP